ncbi:MAG: Asp23/Gls24 family envelope stress response protein [Christensenellales bacterium]
MSVNTTNSYGKIYIADEALESVCGKIALDCYGVIDLVANKFSDNLHELFKKKNASKGVKVLTVDNKIYIDLFVILKYGVSINAVAESLKSSIKYFVEKFTGMIVDTVNVNVLGIRV